MNNSKKKTSLHLMNAIEIYEKYKFNRSVLCVTFKTMKKHREDLAKLVFPKSEQQIVPLSMNFSKVSFTLAAFANFDHNDKSTTSGTSSTHATRLILQAPMIQYQFFFKRFPLLK